LSDAFVDLREHLAKTFSRLVHKVDDSVSRKYNLLSLTEFLTAPLAAQISGVRPAENYKSIAVRIGQAEAIES